MADQAERSEVAYDAAVVSGEPALNVDAFYVSLLKQPKNSAPLQTQRIYSPPKLQISVQACNLTLVSEITCAARTRAAVRF